MSERERGSKRGRRREKMKDQKDRKGKRVHEKEER
jgi:hypothetical protein